MRQALGDYDDRNDDVELVGDDRAEEFGRPERRLPMVLLALGAMAVFAGGLWFAYVQGTHHPAAQAQAAGDKVPLIRADDAPSKVRPDQPGGMPIPDQNVSIYNEKPGGPTVEKLLPAPEQPLPRPAPAPPPAAAAPSAPPAPNPQVIVAPAVPPAAPAVGAAASAHPSPPAARPKAAAAAPSAAAKHGPIRLQLGSLRSPDAARAEWARLKREQPELLGKLTAVAVKADLGEKGIYYRIEAGQFADAAAANRLCGELRRRNLGCSLAR